MTVDHENRPTHPDDYMNSHYGKPALQEDAMPDKLHQPAQTPAAEHHDGHAHAEHDHDAAKAESWKAAAENHASLLRAFGGQEDLVVTPDHAVFPVLKEHIVAQHEILEVGCIDEGCGHQGGGYHIGMGGAGVLVEKGNLDGYVNHIVDKAVADGVKKIKIDAHEGCGAAKLALNAAGVEAPTAEDVNTHAQKFAGELAALVTAEVQKRGLQVTVEQGYLSADKMIRPAEFHNATGVSFDTTKSFDPTRVTETAVEDLPPLFNIDGSYDLDHTVANVGVAKGIAFGGHGFAERFTKEQPFAIVVVRNSADAASVEQSQKAVTALRAYLEKQPEFAEGKIVLKTVDIKSAIEAAKAA